MIKKPVDIIITHAHLLTMQGRGVGYIADGAVAILDSQIVGVDSTEAILNEYSGKKIIDATDSVVLPGLINAHIDTSLMLTRGVAQDINDWLMRGIWPYLMQITPETSVAASQLSVLQGLKAGTTTFVDNKVISPQWGELFVDMGVRAILAPMFDALPAAWTEQAGALYPFDIQAGRRAMDAAVAFACAWNGAAEGRITTQLGMYSPDMLPLELLKEAKHIAQREGLGLHVHVAQGDRETAQIMQRYGKRPVALLEEIGYLDEQLLAVHLTDATDEEVRQVAASGAGMALCSGIIGMIDGLVPPAQVFRQAGGSVALGSSYHNIFHEMSLTAYVNKIRYQDPTMMPAWDVLRMATIEGARAIGLAHEIGSLEAGKQADLIFVDLKKPHLTPTLLNPIRNLVPNLVYAASGHDVKRVMVAGKLLIDDYVVLVADEMAIMTEAQMQAEQFEQRVKTDPICQKMALMRAMVKKKL